MCDRFSPPCGGRQELLLAPANQRHWWVGSVDSSQSCVWVGDRILCGCVLQQSLIERSHHRWRFWQDGAFNVAILTNITKRVSARFFLLLDLQFLWDRGGPVGCSTTGWKVRSVELGAVDHASLTIGVLRQVVNSVYLTAHNYVSFSNHSMFYFTQSPLPL